MEGLQINNLTDRDILIMLYQKVQQMDKSFDQHKKDTKEELETVKERLQSIEKYVNDQNVKDSIDAKRSKKQMWFIGILITVLNLLVNIFFHIFK
ncbi:MULTISPECIES: hypothetical protein [unclassified Paraflavitalea]|uniref:hypothetical protein n=1 Tax=unclassified Paraflavitalea TaxID=2798305 RepID=UPI003D32D462